MIRLLIVCFYDNISKNEIVICREKLMKRSLKNIFNILICLLIFIIIFFGFKRFNSYYNIEYDNDSKGEIQSFIQRNEIKLKAVKYITNITMVRVIPSGYRYTIYYIDSDNNKQSEAVSRKSETTFKDYIIKNGENLEKKYSNICRNVFYIFVIVMIIKIIIIYRDNKKQKLLER